MELDKIQRFKQMVHSNPTLRLRLHRAVLEHEGLNLSDRALFDAVLAPIARKAGINLTYEEAEAELRNNRELDDDELDAVAGGVGTVYKRAVSGILAATMVVSTIPTTALAEEMGQTSAATKEPTVLIQQEQAGNLEEPMVSASADTVVKQAEPAAAGATEEPATSAEDPTAAVQDEQSPAEQDEAVTARAADEPAVVTPPDATSANLEYEAGKLDYVDKTAQQVKALGSGVFDALAAGTSGYAKAGVVGVQKLLVLAGVLGTKDDGVSSELLTQTKRLNALVQGMSKQLDENTKQTYQNRLTVFDNAVGALDIECGTMETMYQKGYALAKERGLLEEAEKNGDLDNTLVKLMRDEDAKGNPDFRDFSVLMNSIRTNYETVAVECAKEGGASPFYAFDSYWALYFNFDTQGYYLRQAYRTNAELQLKRAYTLLALYYNLPQTLDAGKEAEPMTAALQAALKGIAAQPAGTSPEAAFDRMSETQTYRYLKTPIHCYTTGRDYHASRLWSWFGSLGSDGQISEDQAKAFCERLHGHTVAEDLRLAGLMIEYTPYWNEWSEAHGRSLRLDEAHYPGLGIGYDDSGKDWQNIYLPFDATSYTPKRCSSDGYELLYLSGV